MFLDIKESPCECHACGHVFFHVWTGKANAPAVERFPIECPKCGKKEAYRAPDEDVIDLDG